ncbi:aldehyde dehydrogenase family protein [Nocardia brasiliensis]|uniref:aldehyde dehydrogenase family protein n=1 Tax=Nocardia brasiliensis TaxID=37326 RepID=UPI0036731FAC
MSTLSRGLIIGGHEIPAANGNTIDDISPWTGETYATVAACTLDDVAAAVDAASEAFAAWSKTPPIERSAILNRAADILTERSAEAIEVMVAELGATRKWGQFQVHLGVAHLRGAAALASAPLGRVVATNSTATTTYSMEIREPLGVVASLSPWNAPYALGIRATAIPLAVGNTVVLKPSEDSPIAGGLFIADILSEAGLPPGVLDVVTNDPADAGEVVAALVADFRVRMVNFTGSTKVGRIIGSLAGQHLKPVTLELGGKNALIVLKDADVEFAVRAATFGSYMNSGQICMSSDRILVHKNVAASFIEKLAGRVDSLTYGDPGDPVVDIGPVVNARAAQGFSELIADAVAKGAVPLVGSGKAEGQGGVLFKPVLLAEVTKDMQIYYQEIFGPAAVIHIVDSAEQAIDIANDSSYGLSCGIISENIKEALSVAAGVQTGVVHINDQSVGDEPMAAFGGVKDSGYGRFGGQPGADDFTTVRWVTVHAEPAHPSYLI